MKWCKFYLWLVALKHLKFIIFDAYIKQVWPPCWYVIIGELDILMYVNFNKWTNMPDKLSYETFVTKIVLRTLVCGIITIYFLIVLKQN